MKLWSLAVPLLTSGGFTFIINFSLFYLFSDPETEIWNFTNENHKVTNPALPNSYYRYGIATYIATMELATILDKTQVWPRKSILYVQISQTWITKYF